ncbi:MAG: tRNA1(Val) (adenine(37)-N6)-methyltransferase [Bacteroidales bacterium]
MPTVSQKRRRPFVFKQFTIYHDRCAMPLSTDSILLGAWVSIDTDRYLLDVGSGCGIISLMLAQRNPLCTIDAIEIDFESYQQGLENINASRWVGRIHAYHNNFVDYVRQCTQKYDHVVCNPPFFQHDLQSPHSHRTIARHAHSLSFAELINGATAILSDQGKLSVIIPYSGKDDFIRECLKNDLFCIRATGVRSTIRMPFMRSLFTFARVPRPLEETILTLYHNGPKQPTAEYAQLTKAFYLKME